MKKVKVTKTEYKDVEEAVEAIAESFPTLEKKPVNLFDKVEYARAFYLDRVKELRNQVPFGDPHVFIGATAVAGAMGDLFNHVRNGKLRTEGTLNYTNYTATNCTATIYFPPSKIRWMYNYQPRYYAEALENLVKFATTYNLNAPYGRKLGLSHVNEDHFKTGPNDTLILAASPFLDDLEFCIKALFDEICKEDIKTVRAVLYFLENPIFGTIQA